MNNIKNHIELIKHLEANGYELFGEDSIDVNVIELCFQKVRESNFNIDNFLYNIEANNYYSNDEEYPWYISSWDGREENYEYVYIKIDLNKERN